MSEYLTKLATVRGVNAYLGANYGITWANEKVAFEVCDWAAKQIDGPATLPEAGLYWESGAKIGQLLVQKHTELKPHGYTGDPDSLRKTASNWSVADLAVATTNFDMDLMSKRADAMIMQGGQHTNRPGESPESTAKLDEHNRPQGTYLVGLGNTDLNPSGSAIVGKEEPHPKAPENTSPTNNSVTEHSKAAGMMDTLKGYGSSVSGAAQRAGSSVADMGRRAGSSVADMGRSVGSAVGNSPEAMAHWFQNLDPQTQMMIATGGAGAVGGAGAGALSAGEGNRLQGAAVGGLAGGALGAGAGYGLRHYGDKLPESMSNYLEQSSDPRFYGTLAAGGAALGGAAGGLAGMSQKESSYANILKSAQEIGLSNDQTIALLNKLAGGGSLTDSKTNTPEDAAKHDETAKLDMKNRSPEKYLKGVGKTDMPNVGRVEHASKRPDQPGVSDKAPNTVASRETKSAADEAFVMIFRKTAEEVGPYLPSHMDEETKIAHIRMMMGMAQNERANYIRTISN